MIGRPKNFDQQVALQAATHLFWRRGYTATSLDDLLGVMSLSKSSFYAEFKSKEALYRTCLKGYQQLIVSHLDQTRSASSSLRDFLDAVFQEAIDDATSGDPKGCLIVNSAVEFGQHRKQFTEDVRLALEAVQKALEAAIQMAIRNGEFATPSSPKLLAKAITTLMSGVRTMIKGGMPTKDAKAVAQIVLDSILA
jgi:TetR/AcrR family transcriptional regulator, transcriptional repressor for nem operon